MSPLTRRATAEFRAATPRQRSKGEQWYPDAHGVARDQVEEYGVTIEVASGIIAALSPRLGWGSNVMLAERMLNSRGTLDRGYLSRGLAQARAIHAGADPLEVLRGPKTRAFYLAVLTAGEGGGAVIDRHAWDMLVGKRGATPPTTRQYRDAADKMSRAAGILGVGVHVVQATTWVSWREKFWSPGAFGHAPRAMLEGARAW